ncbi:SPOR domain-containing protein [Acidocella sp.]|uniref:SPOR domain-containing protein n=1 Tax=Acidocella sp. TaxID=50710 RepID=UPI00262BB5C2|nr:SPOR domain-containing protein [Acidocella sp.]
MQHQSRHYHGAKTLRPARAHQLSGIALAVSLILTGCAGNGGNNSVASNAPTGTIGTNTLNVADAAIAGGDASMALSVSQSILDRDPNNVDALVHEGDAYYALGRCPAAEAAYQKALQNNPKSAAAETGYGRCLLKVNPAGAEVAFTAAAQDDPGDGNALSDLGIARDLQGNFTGAAAAYQQSLMANPGSVATAVNLGLSLALSGQGAAALQYLGPLATGPDATPKIREDYAAALVSAGRPDDARQVLAIDMPPDKVDQAMAGFQALIDKNVASPPPPAAPPPTVPQVQTAPVTAMPETPATPTPLMPAASTAPAQAAPAQPAPPPVAEAPPPPVAQAAPPPVAQAAPPPVVQAAPPPVAQAARPAALTAPVVKTAYSTNRVFAPAPVAPPDAASAVPSPAEVADLSPPASVPTPQPMATVTSGRHEAAVQIAALNTRGAAQAEWRKVTASAPALFADKTPDISKVKVSGQTYYRLRVSGFASHESAAQFCSMVTSAGSPCMPAF